MNEDEISKAFDSFKLKARDGRNIENEFERFRTRHNLGLEYRAWIDDVTFGELCLRLTIEPKTWPQIVKDFPAPWLPGHEGALGRAIARLKKSGQLIITSRHFKNYAGFEWDESLYSVSVLQQLAGI